MCRGGPELFLVCCDSSIGFDPWKKTIDSMANSHGIPQANHVEQCYLHDFT